MNNTTSNIYIYYSNYQYNIGSHFHSSYIRTNAAEYIYIYIRTYIYSVKEQQDGKEKERWKEKKGTKGINA